MICLLVSGPDDFQIWLWADGNCLYVILCHSCNDEMCKTFFTISMLVSYCISRYKCTYTVTTDMLIRSWRPANSLTFSKPHPQRGAF